MLTIYTKHSCPACVQAKTLLDNYEIPYMSINIDEDKEAKEFVLSKGHRSVPAIYKDGKQFVTGYPELMKLGKSGCQELYNK